jgi:hypothetical protein
MIRATVWHVCGTPRPLGLSAQPTSGGTGGRPPGRYQVREGVRSAPNMGADDGNRTRMTSLEGWSSTIELHPRDASAIGAMSSLPGRAGFSRIIPNVYVVPPPTPASAWSAPTGHKAGHKAAHKATARHSRVTSRHSPRNVQRLSWCAWLFLLTPRTQPPGSPRRHRTLSLR